MTAPLAIAMEMRGHDSWGVTDGDFVFKEPKAITEGFMDFELEGPIYHTRAASVGAVSERNAHPFDVTSADGTTRVVGIHNGHIHNYQYLSTKYNRDIQVDSEHIFHHLAEGVPLDDIHGWGAVVWFEHKGGKVRRFLSKFGSWDNLHVAKLKDGTLCFASTDSAITMAARFANIDIKTFYDIKENVLYEFAQGDVLNGGKFEWGRGNEWHAMTTTSGRTSYGLQPVCAVPHCNNKVSTDNLICLGCLEETLIEYGMQKVTA